jgi:zinc/manganese transport system substrate-binding protein
MNGKMLTTIRSRAVLLLLLVLSAPPALALNVFACEPEWGALVDELAGELVSVTVATTAFQDPHKLQARPSLIASARSADLLVCTGAELEVGWLPLLLRRAANPRIQTGSPGYFLAAEYVRRIEIPTRIDRTQGDVHPQGNPHVQLNPNNITRIARALSDQLQAIDPVHAQDYRLRTDSFLERWQAAIERWELEGENLAGMRLVSHHTSFSYLADWLQMDIVATLENKPGIPPSGAHLAKLLEQLQADPPMAVIRTPYDDEKPSLWLAQRLDIPAVMLPYTIGGEPGVNNLFDLFDVTLKQLEALRQ